MTLSFLMSLLGYAMIRKIRFSIVLLALFSLYSTFWFNPLVRGGSSFLRDNELSKKILELNEKSGKNSVWVVFGDIDLINLPRILGVKSLNGTHFYPQMALWRALDPEGKYDAAYNRYAHVIFMLSKAPEVFRIRAPFSDVVQVIVHPDHPAFSKLEVDYILVQGPDRVLLDQDPHLQKEFSLGDKNIYRFLRGPIQAPSSQPAAESAARRPSPPASRFD